MSDEVVLQQMADDEVSPEITVNELARTLSAAGIFGLNQDLTNGLTWGYYGGYYNGNSIADGTVTLTNAATNYVVVLRSTGVVSVSTSTTNGADPLYAKLYRVTTLDSAVSAVRDQRMDSNGLLIGSVGSSVISQNSQSAAYTLVLGDAGKHIYHPSADTTARIWTIPANASVAFEIGTAVTFVNDGSAGAITIAITSDTLVLAGPGSTGSRTLAANGVATALKITATRWQISGTGLS